MSTITDLIAQIDSLDDEDVVFARPEWNELSEARVLRLTQDFRAPPEAIQDGLTYFLEVNLIREVLSEFSSSPNAPLGAKVRRVIEYARFDA